MQKLKLDIADELLNEETVIARPQQRAPESGRTRFLVVLFLVVAVAGAVAVGSRYPSLTAVRPTGPAPVVDSSVPVNVARVQRADIPYEIRAVGHVVAYKSVGVVSQVGGEILRVLFKQGAYVSRGQPLFAIDARPLQAQLDQSRAATSKDQQQIAQVRATLAQHQAQLRESESTLARDLAQARFLQAQDKRYQDMLDEGMVTEEQADQHHTDSLSNQETVRSDRAALRAARALIEADLASLHSAEASLLSDEAGERSVRVQLEHTLIRSPLDGRSGTLSLVEGAAVRASDSAPLVTINQIQPIFVKFAVPEQHLADIQRYQAQGPLRVSVVPARGNGPEEIGRVSYSENQVDSTTGTISLRASFTNASRRL